MRIGEILIAASLVDAKKLQIALEYASAKSIPVGGALRALKYLTEQELKRAFDAQQGMVKGLDEKVAIDVLSSAHANQRTFVEELKMRQGDLGKEAISDNLIYWLSVPSSLESTVITGLKMPTQHGIAPRSPDKLVIQADQFFEANQLLEAEQAYMQAKHTWEDEYFPPKEKIVVVLTKLANLYLATNRFEGAHKLYARVVEMQTELRGDESMEVVRALEDVADLYDLESNQVDAQLTYKRALDILEKLPEDVITASRLIKKFSGTCNMKEGADRLRFGELALDAGLLTQDALEAALKFGKENSQPLGVALRTQNVLTNTQVESLMFAQVIVKQGSLAPPAIVRAIKLCSAQDVALKLLADAGKWVSEEMSNDPTYKRLLTEQEKLLNTESVLGPNDPEVGLLAISVADIHFERKDRPLAQAFFQRGINILEKADWHDKTVMIRAYDKLAQIFYQQNKFTEAQTNLLKSLEARRAAGRGDTPEAAKCLWLLGKLGIAQRNKSAALSYLMGAKKLFEQMGSDQIPKQLIDEITACNAG